VHVFFDFRLLDYEIHTYIASGYSEPEELLNNSGIHIHLVVLYDTHYLANEDVARDNYERDSIQIFGEKILVGTVLDWH